MDSTLKPGLVCLLVVAAAAGAAAAMALVDRWGAGTSSRAAAGWLALWLAVALGVLLGWRWRAAATASRPTAVDPGLRAAAYRQVADRFSHELNNQLGIMSNSAYLIERRSQDPRLDMPVQAMLRAADCASKLGFHLYRLSSSQGRPGQTMDISHWLPSLQDVMALALGKRASLDLHAAPAALQICIDPDALELAMASLLSGIGPKLEPGSRVGLSVHQLETAEGWPIPPGAYVGLHLQMLCVVPPGAVGEGPRPDAQWVPAQQADDAGMQLLGQVVTLEGGHARLREEPGGRVALWVLLPQALSPLRAAT
ncbi:MAG: hypothetical protein ACN6O1_08370 [Comamonas sp.]|uniref:hypothetical protein n=1 Tax=Comamonas sp. TaxID=34028 RepID=UPI003D0C13E0